MQDPRTIGQLLNDVAKLMRKRFGQRAGSRGWTRAQWQTLTVLSKNEGIMQRQLAELLEIEPITLTRILDRLIKQGLVERRSHPTDRRAFLVYTSELAQSLLGEMRELGTLTRAEALQNIDEAEQLALLNTLSTMKENLARACRSPIDE